jgi:hypothetical protein
MRSADVRFSNRPFGVKHFQVSAAAVSMSSGAGTPHRPARWLSAFDPSATSTVEFAVMHNAALIQQCASLWASA